MAIYDLAEVVTDGDLKAIKTALGEPEKDVDLALRDSLDDAKLKQLTHDDISNIVNALFYAINRYRNNFGQLEDILPFNVALGHVSLFPDKASK